jgi:hypothetical protein
VLIDLILGCTAKAVLAKFTPTGDMRAGTATVTVKRPKFGLDAVAQRPIKGAKIGVPCFALMMERRIKEASTEGLGGPRSSVRCTKHFGRRALM